MTVPEILYSIMYPFMLPLCLATRARGVKERARLVRALEWKPGNGRGVGGRRECRSLE